MGKSEKKTKDNKKEKHHKDKKSHKKSERNHEYKHANSSSSSRGSKSSDNGSESLSLLLTHGLLRFPGLMEELPAMLIAMDSGESVNVAAISNPARREMLTAVFSHDNMPADLYDDGRGGGGWAKSVGCQCIRRAVLNFLVDNGDVINPQDLTRSQSRAVRMAPVLQGLLRQIPELIGDLGQILRMLSEGETVDLSGMDNRDVKKALSRCLADIGVDHPESGEREGEGGSATNKYLFCLSSDGFDGDVLREALRSNAEVLTEMKVIDARWSAALHITTATTGSKTAGALPGAHRRSPSSESQLESGSSDDADDSDSDGGGPLPARAGTGTSGPARPSTEQLVAAKAAAIALTTADESDEADDDAAGFPAPLPAPDVQGVVAAASSTSDMGGILGALGAEGFDFPTVRPKTGDGDDDTAATTTGGREEWMLTPGENRPSGGVDQLFAGKNKFQGGKEAKKAAAALKAEREAVAELMEDPEETRKTEALLAEYREKRGPSLMDAHLEKIGKKPKISDTRLKTFDHEKEMGGHRKMNIKDVHGMVEKSRELDTRFDKASIQKNFL